MVLPRRPTSFDRKVPDSGPSAFLIDNGGSKARTDLGLSGNAWAVREALFDLRDPTKVVACTDTDIFYPERDYEIKHAGSGGNNNDGVFTTDAPTPGWPPHSIAGNQNGDREPRPILTVNER